MLNIDRAKTALERVLKARAELILTRTFYGVLVGQVSPQMSDKIPTAATNGKVHFWNPDFVHSLPQEEVLGTQAHESEHDARRHGTRRGGRDPKKWNEACDYAINIDLVAQGFKLPKGALIDPKYRGMSAEDIYRSREIDEALEKQKQQEQEQADNESDPDEGEGEPSDNSEGEDHGDETEIDAEESEEGGDDEGDEGNEGESDSGDATEEADEADETKGGGDEGEAEQGDDQGEGEGNGGDAEAEADDQGDDEGSGSGSGEAEGDAEGEGTGEGSGDAEGEANGNGETEAEGEGESDEPQSCGDPGGCGEVLDSADTAAEVAEEDCKWERVLRQAAALAAKRGEAPGHVAREIEHADHPPQDWRETLRAFFDGGATTTETWNKPNRRFIGGGLYLPGRVRDGVNRAVFMIDTSGSVTYYPGALEAIKVETQAALDEQIIDEAVVIYGDTRVTRVDTYRNGDEIEFDPRGGGGTVMKPMFDYVANEVDSASLIVAFTDLEIEPEAELGPAPHCPVLWAVVGYPQNVKRYLENTPWNAPGIEVRPE